MELLGDKFNSVSLEIIPDATLQTLGFYYSPLGYLKEEAPQFVDVTNKLKLAIEPEDDGQPITDSKGGKTRKMLKRIAKRKVWRNNLHSFIWQALAAGSTALLLSYPPVSTLLFCLLMPVLLFHPSVPALLSHLGSSTRLLSRLSRLFTLSSYFPISTLLFCPPLPP